MVAPFYNGLEIATAARPWPELGASQARRASVNSFGFGGANAHVVLENFEPANSVAETYGTKEAARAATFPPFVFSAASETALQGMLEAYAAHLNDNPDLPTADLAYTLYARRSVLGARAAFPAVSGAQALAASIANHLDNARADPGLGVAIRPTSAAPRVLGIFTGQGAQWAAMGKGLIQGSAFVRERLTSLESVLSSLPSADRPSWSLVDQLIADAASSRLGEAEIAQPVCTAVQIVLVDLLRTADVEFAAVVGHSSGEIAAAYAARVLSAEEAIKIGYYRGLCAEKYVGAKGAMLAVGTSLEDANELCGLSEFAGRVTVAACNSPSSVTLSGDVDAVQEAKALLEDEKKFARLLRVDKAYHSHHMAACADPYQQMLKGCNIEPREARPGRCAWYSSVYPDTQMGLSPAQVHDLKAKYWKDNMVQPVLFAHALETAVLMNKEAPFNMVIEVGPHPALQGPASDTLAALCEREKLVYPPYSGTLRRGEEDIGALSATLGSLWCRFTRSAANLFLYDATLAGQDTPARRLVPNLPTYCWDHDRVFWHDSRISRAMRYRKDAGNPLLGNKLPDGLGDETRWRNIIRPGELPWIRGHQLQGQMVYPAAAYLCTAIESSAALAEGRAIDTVEIRDFALGKALVFDGNNEQAGVETLFALSNISRPRENQVEAGFTFHAALRVDAEVLSRLASGRITVTLSGATESGEQGIFARDVPTRAPEPTDLVPVHEETFYSSLRRLGYEYTDDFRALSRLRRKMDYGSAYARVPGHERAEDAMLLHPALLDLALQAIMLAYCDPQDGNFDQLHVPTGVASLTINMALCRQDLVEGVQLPVESFLTENPLISNIIVGNVDVYGRDERTPLVRVQGVRLPPLAERTSRADRPLFREQAWGIGVPDCSLAADRRATALDFEIASDLERLSVYYIRQVTQQIPPSQRQHLEWHQEAMFDYFEHVLDQTSAGLLPSVRREWLEDTWDDMLPILNAYPDRVDIKLTCVVGENLVASVRGETQLLQHMFKDELLNRYYIEAVGIRETTQFLARTVAQVAHRYPNMNILEIGAGTGAATKAVFAEIENAFWTYTYTDISTGFMERAQATFGAMSGKMVFSALNIERDVVEQGYREHSYDMVIGSFVLHATKNLKKTLLETRRLLRPGGYLVLSEVTDLNRLRVGFAMSGLPGWWLGREDGRRYSPCVTSAQWHKVLLETGFSGIDTITPEVDTLPRPFSVFVSQAVDQRVRILREPILFPEAFEGSSTDNGNLVIVGGQSLTTVVLIDCLLRLMHRFAFHITRLSSLEEITASALPERALILNLAELDRPVFSNLTDSALQGIQAMVDYQRTVLWLTQGCRADQPYMNMSVGMGRTLALEVPAVRIQFLDLDFARQPDARLVAEALLRFHFTRERASVQDVLYSVESELAEEGGRLLVPRLLPIRQANERYNSTKRRITRNQHVQESPLVLTTTGSAYAVHAAVAHQSACPDEVLVHATDTTLMPVTGDMHGIFGQDRGSGRWVLGLSRTNGSCVPIRRNHLHSLGDGQPDDDYGRQLLARLTIEAQCRLILFAIPQGGTLVAHEPSPFLVQRLLELAGEGDTRVTVAVTTSSPSTYRHMSNACSVIGLSPSTPKRTVRAALPSEVSLFVDCSIGPRGTGLGFVVASSLPTSCWATHLGDLRPYSQHTPGSRSTLDLSEMLQQVIAHHESRAKGPPVCFNALPLNSLVAAGTATLTDDSATATPALVDWNSGEKVPVTIRSVDSVISFQPNKTYVMFGLTGDLGRSLVEWMGTRGARNIVLTSRRPDIDSQWLEECRTKGMRVEVFAK